MNRAVLTPEVVACGTLAWDEVRFSELVSDFGACFACAFTNN